MNNSDVDGSVYARESDDASEPEVQEPECDINIEDDILDDEEEEIVDDELSQAQARIKELEVELATERANIFNERQRLRKESQATRQRTQDEVITALLPALDLLDMALRTPVSDSESDAAARNILKGVEMTRAQFLNILDNNYGVTVITVPEGAKFDHNLHNASATVAVDDPELDGKVIDQQLTGYKSKNSNRVLRPAHVTVGKAE